MCLVSLTLAAPACVGRPVVVAKSSDCASLVPGEWEKGVEGAPIPAASPPKPATLADQLAQAIDQLKSWVGFGVDESNRRVQANGRTKDAIDIIRRCEERDRQAVQAARPKVLGIF
jgi:hypothetical protein